MRYVSVDCETTGLEEGCVLLECAMVLEDTAAASVTPVEQLPFFVGRILPPSAPCWESFACTMHNESGLLAVIKAMQGNMKYRNGANPMLIYEYDEPNTFGFERARDFETDAMLWLINEQKVATWDKKQRVVVAGKNCARFDARFLPRDLMALFHHRVIDAGSVFIDWSKDTPPSLDELRGQKVAHRALEDARDVIRVLRRDYGGLT